MSEAYEENNSRIKDRLREALLQGLGTATIIRRMEKQVDVPEEENHCQVKSNLLSKNLIREVWT